MPECRGHSNQNDNLIFIIALNEYSTIACHISNSTAKQNADFVSTSSFLSIYQFVGYFISYLSMGIYGIAFKPNI